MKLIEMKEKVYRLIEELSDDATRLTDDPDYEKKINTCINMIQNELARIKRIPEKETYDTSKGSTMELPDDCYQVNKITGCMYELIGNEINFDEDYKGIVTIYYYKYPKQITENTIDTYTFELSQDALEIMPFGVAGDMLKSDPSTNYGQVYSSRYNELKQYLDSRNNVGLIYIDTKEAID